MERNWKWRLENSRINERMSVYKWNNWYKKTSLLLTFFGYSEGNMN